ncbi:hypothetical protein BG454_14935 [Roseinatronobacter bogoriensis subsp. barguzinensis]|uniref:Uncharacterized protein n=1 Tax=Roseinatronobacter bogoriensis subsp. barguzinensis TaxID=441209 RepID=A0A2K8KBY7_9RHOB|nr:hypothetical protein BG454_14935 [Rhodobaca barguzinensis]
METCGDGGWVAAFVTTRPFGVRVQIIVAHLTGKPAALPTKGLRALLQICKPIENATHISRKC